VPVGVADAAGHEPDEHFLGGGLLQHDVFDYQWRVGFVGYDCCCRPVTLSVQGRANGTAILSVIMANGTAILSVSVT
jgi:hypothetical protein